MCQDAIRTLFINVTLYERINSVANFAAELLRRWAGDVAQLSMPLGVRL